MQDQRNLQSLRQLNANSYVQIQHNNLEMEQHIKTGQSDNMPNHNHQKVQHQPPQVLDEHGHNHSDGSSCSRAHRPGSKNYFIIVYTIFTCLSCGYLESQHLNPLIGDQRSKIMTFVAVVNVVMCIWSYLQTIKTDPGVTKLQDKQIKPYPYLNYKKNCDKCKYWKAPRVSHCSTCGKCIYKLDHHCIWTQTCIGHSNQRPFYLFCFYMTIGVLQFWYSTIRAWSILSNNCSFFSVFDTSIYALWILSCFSAGLVGLMIIALCIGHSFMVTTNFSTLDSMKTKQPCNLPFLEFRKKKFEIQSTNDWDRGQIQNLKSLFGRNFLTFWMPLGREVINQYIFQPMHPVVDMVNYKEPISITSDELSKQMTGKKIRINQQTFQL